MNSALWSLLFVGSLFTPNYARAQEVPLPPVVIFMDVSTTTSVSVAGLIYQAEVRYGLPNDNLLKTLECESGLQSRQSNILHVGGPNGLEDSWGVAQIHLTAHKDVTKEEAMDPAFAVDWAANEFAQGRAFEWTCYRNLFE